MLRRLVTVSLVLVAAACSTPEPAPPPSAGGEVGSQVTPSLDATTLRITVAPSTTTLRTTVMPGMTEVIMDTPCELLTRDEQVELGLEAPGTPQRPGFVCNWVGKDFSMVISTNHAMTLAQIEAGRPGERITIASRRAASMARGEGEFAGLCDLAVDIVRIANARIVLSRYDKNTSVACLNAIKVASLIHFRLPGA